ncbi:MAG: fasciclin domain-containing protein [Myxococcales bacterium]|nr:MAG: fasciclin domain-containing protein [Myxococcales bacterium]
MKTISQLVFLAATLSAAACGGEMAQEPPATADSAMAEPAAAPAEKPTSNILQTAAAAGSFSTLSAAIKAAGLEETLSGPGPFTVFAPTDDAFAKLPAGTVENLLKPENKAKLVAILTYHVVPGEVPAKDVLAAKKLKSVQGQELSVAVDGANVSVDGAKVVKTDIMASNGVIHVLDAVLLPKG